MSAQIAYSPLVKPTEEMLQSRKNQISQMYPHARVFQIRTADPVLKTSAHLDKLKDLPQTITLITPDHNDPSKDTLYVGYQPIAKENWSYDANTANLRFKQGSGDSLLGGEFRLVKDRTSGFGLLQMGQASFSTEMQVKPVTYDIKIAQGAAYVAGSSTAPQLKWDCNSDNWKNAQWTQYKMQLTYGIEEEGSIAGQKVYYVKCVFHDDDTGEDWDPGYGNYTAYMTADMKLNFTLNVGIDPQPDPSNPIEKFNSKIFPYVLNIQMDPFAQSFTGAMLCGKKNLDGTVYGLQGAYDASAVNGMYTLSIGTNSDCSSPTIVSVHNGKLVINQEPIENSHQIGHRVEWGPTALASKVGLPESGYLDFSSDGASLIGGSNNAQGSRLAPEAAINLTNNLDHLPDTQKALLHATSPTSSANDGNGLNFMDLINMSQFVQDQNGGWYDAVQQDSMQDFYNIIQYYMPSDLRQQFVNPNPVNLDATIKSIAQMSGNKGTPASDWYSSLSTAYLTGMMSQWTNEPDRIYLNGNRANKWLKQQTGPSDVFSVQGPALYANRWYAKFPETNSFVVDQQKNSDKYASLIDQDIQQWKQSLQNTVEADADQMNDLMKSVDEIAAKAKAQNYWTYIVFRYCTNTPFLNMLQTISFNPDGLDGSEFARRVQQIVAVLNVLDQSSYFTQQFAYTIQLFQTANILPQLIDYSGDLDTYSYAINSIIQKFISTYINSPDPDMQAAAQAMQQMSEQKMMGEILQILQQVSVSSGGLYSWGQLVSNFQSKVAKVFGGLPKFAATGVALAAVAFGIVAFATGQIKWSDLSTTQQVSIIGGGIGVFAQLVMLVVKRGVAVGAVIAPNSGFGSGLRLFFSRDLMTTAQREATTGFRRWLLSDGGIPPAAKGADEFGIATMFAREEALAAEKEMSSSVRFLFGRNMNEFVATRLGTIVAIFGLVMSAISLAQSQGALEIAANSLFVAASSLDLIATAGAWIVGGTSLGTTAVGGLMVSTIFPILGAIAVLAMVAGAVLMILFMNQKPPSPVKTFAENQAKNKGYYMPYGTEIDYFEIYQPSAGPQMAGVSLVSSDPKAGVLKMSNDGKVSMGAIDHTANTSFYLNVDEFGRASFVAPLVDDKSVSSAKYLTLDDNGQITAAAPISDGTKVTQQMWRAEMLGAPNYDQNKNLVSASFAFYNEYYSTQGDKKKLYLKVSNGAVTTDTVQQSWTVQMVTTSPAGLKMKDLTLYVYNRDLSQGPSLSMPGSSPQKWTIDPALPSFLQINPSTGTVSQKTSVAPDVFTKTSFTLKVDNAVGTASTTFSIEVLAASDPQSLSATSFKEMLSQTKPTLGKASLS